jgi:hypothetical protein
MGTVATSRDSALKCLYTGSHVHCGENSRIFRDAADQTLPVTEYSEIYS